jgi:3-phosphoshikimate 1-carboxyvinyltransferase
MGTLTGPGDPPGQRRATDGRPLDGVRVRVTPEGGLEVHSRWLFAGYGLGAERDRSAFTADGWYRTGDLAECDDAGYLRVTGRTTDVVNRGGEKVPVVAIEHVLAEHEAVADVAIAGLPDDRLGERACAFVVLEPGRELGLDDVRRHLERHGVTRRYWPERLEIVERLPRNGAGKVQKFVLRRSVEGADVR